MSAKPNSQLPALGTSAETAARASSRAAGVEGQADTVDIYGRVPGTLTLSAVRPAARISPCMHARSKACLTVLLAALATAPTTAAKNVAPPGNAGVQEYQEQVPSASGGQPPKGDHSPSSGGSQQQGSGSPSEPGSSAAPPSSSNGSSAGALSAA